MKNILIFSNNAASSSESNGRIHMTQFLSYKNITNFYIRGIPDLEYVKYLSFSYKSALKMKLGFKGRPKDASNKASSKSAPNKKGKKPLFHYLRNKCFSNNLKIIDFLNQTIKNNHIDVLIIWGTDIPFLYEYAYKLSKKCKIPLVIITGENYPLKKYNYISQKQSLFFGRFQKSLYKWAKRAYQHSSANIYLNKELKEAYEKEFDIKDGHVIFFGSSLKPAKKETWKIENILYGGNLYEDRVSSIIQIAECLKDFDSVKINVYGDGYSESRHRLSAYKNINYCGTVPYETLVDQIYSSDLLLHVEGFSKEYVRDCEFAFSTKIADYMSTHIPFFCYGSKRISGIKFMYELNPDATAVSKDELYKLVQIINGKPIIIKGSELFDSGTISRQVQNIIEGV